MLYGKPNFGVWRKSKCNAEQYVDNRIVAADFVCYDNKYHIRLVNLFWIVTIAVNETIVNDVRQTAG